jgi:hypothetical protein
MLGISGLSNSADYKSNRGTFFAERDTLAALIGNPRNLLLVSHLGCSTRFDLRAWDHGFKRPRYLYSASSAMARAIGTLADYSRRLL